MMKVLTYVMIAFAMCLDAHHHAQTYRTDQGQIRFVSSARLENIKATSKTMKGAVDLAKQNFAFSVEVNSFEGFNSALQAEHFRENYMETPTFPKATFTGKLIDPVNPNLSTQMIRAKGALSIHGVSRDRIIDVELTKLNKGFQIQSNFHVALDDHNIVIPKLVHQKIAETISVTVEGKLFE